MNNGYLVIPPSQQQVAQRPTLLIRSVPYTDPSLLTSAHHLTTGICTRTQHFIQLLRRLDIAINYQRRDLQIIYNYSLEGYIKAMASYAMQPEHVAQVLRGSFWRCPCFPHRSYTVKRNSILQIHMAHLVLIHIA